MASCISPTVISSSTHSVNKTTNAQLRKIKKPLIERRRRERINECLIQLKTLVLEAMNKDESRYSKMEKADILEMTVMHLKSVQKRLSHSAPTSVRITPESFMTSHLIKSNPSYPIESGHCTEEISNKYISPDSYKPEIRSPSRACPGSQSVVASPNLNANSLVIKPSMHPSCQYLPEDNSVKIVGYIPKQEQLCTVEHINCGSNFTSPDPGSTPYRSAPEINSVGHVSNTHSSNNIGDVACSVSSTSDQVLYSNGDDRIIVLSHVRVLPTVSYTDRDIGVGGLQSNVIQYRNNVIRSSGDVISRNQNVMYSIKNDVWRPW